MTIYFKNGLSGAIFSFASLLPISGSAWTLLEGIGVFEQNDYVSISVSWDNDRCQGSSDFPLFVQIANSYNSSLISTAFAITGREPGRSSAVYQNMPGSNQRYDTDRIIDSGEIYESCWNIPRGFLDLDYDFGRRDRTEALKLFIKDHPPETMNWTAEVLFTTFEE